MARMIPKVTVNPDATGERRLYNYLELALPEDFTVLHSIPFIQEEGRRLYDHEIDFLVLHRELGLLVIEVKGGIEIDYDAESRRWSSTDHNGAKHTLDRDPFDQARSNMYSLIDEMVRRRVLGKEVASRQDFPYGYSYAVAFPDVEIEAEQLPPHALRDITIDFSDLNHLHERVPAIMRRQASSKAIAMGLKQFNSMLYGFLARKFHVTSSISRRLEDEAASFKRLTDEQCEHLDFLDEHKQALIKGYAGTGKTQMAMEKARRLAQDGLDVLFLCYNRALAKDLQLAHQEPWGHIGIFNYHHLCRTIAEQAGKPFIELIPKDKEAAVSFWTETVPAMLDENLDAYAQRYDAIIIDEGQDFHRRWFDGITRLLRDEEEGYLYIFYDENQNLFGGELEFPVAGPPLHLFQNCRNTQSICDVVAEVGAISQKHYRARYNPHGDPVHFMRYRDPAEQVGIIEGIIRDLKEGDVFNNQVAILSPRKRENGCLSAIESLAGCRIVGFNPDEPAEDIVYSTVKSFKGLERDVVIFCDVDGDFLADKPGEAYTAVSRAQHMLFVIHHESWSPPAVPGP